jgi:DeoR/GlpR family transcriptional regulator of sugar metabolism
MEVKKILCQNAKKIVVLIDSEKIGKSSLTPFLRLEDIHHLITDDGTSLEFIEELKKIKVEVDVVSV